MDTVQAYVAANIPEEAVTPEHAEELEACVFYAGGHLQIDKFYEVLIQILLKSVQWCSRGTSRPTASGPITRRTTTTRPPRTPSTSPETSSSPGRHLQTDKNYESIDSNPTNKFVIPPQDRVLPAEGLRLRGRHGLKNKHQD